MEPKGPQKSPKGTQRHPKVHPKAPQKTPQDPSRAPKKSRHGAKCYNPIIYYVFEVAFCYNTIIYYVFTSSEILIFLKYHQNTAPAMLLEHQKKPVLAREREARLKEERCRNVCSTSSGLANKTSNAERRR